MKTFLPTAVIILFASVPAAQAAPPHVISHLEEHAVSGVQQARAIRAAIVSRFSVSHDYPNLIQEADELLDSMNAIHDAVHSGRSRSTMRQMVDHAQMHVRNLDRRLSRSDYTYASPGYKYMTPTGYVSYPPTHHPGHIHVDSTQRMLDGLSSNLRQLESDLQPTMRPYRRPFVYGYGNYGW
ncbi:hypothetical protein Pan44_24670 [Caulifigura coniformis]|uniref:Uncharacterized protein n=1 Tax=Caulifigura coniformis TaxID=2527983 RepID=A0A517SE87_9PLAN|nr:hypothetical protein [Caulifigura coniformis]QDT54434.1 hypothetical protein Pan44_24670 [Caulifigura coniformis]